MHHLKVYLNAFLVFNYACRLTDDLYGEACVEKDTFCVVRQSINSHISFLVICCDDTKKSPPLFKMNTSFLPLIFSAATLVLFQLPFLLL